MFILLLNCIIIVRRIGHLPKSAMSVLVKAADSTALTHPPAPPLPCVMWGPAKGRTGWKCVAEHSVTFVSSLTKRRIWSGTNGAWRKKKAVRVMLEVRLNQRCWLYLSPGAVQFGSSFCVYVLKC